MKVVILAGGLGTRLSEETTLKPKPMVEIGGNPILWHIMKHYSSFGFNEFVICLGYRGYCVKEYFSNYFLHNSDVTFDLRNNKLEVHSNEAESWRVTLVDTGLNTMTGGRVKKIARHIDSDNFCLTYGDGLSNINISDLVSFHEKHGKLATITSVQPPGRFGSLEVEENRVVGFTEKPHGDGGWINGGFFVLNKKVFDFIEDDTTVWEQEPLRGLAQNGQLMAYYHKGFWQPMDTLREKHYLEKLWSSGEAPWKMW
ncbi:MAG: glucose-1-phosphate cytidylyltransferase [Bdellovibrionales bacterium]|nr:glucose-1-phosphate cytidylyltransferase [Bdellovibrionales bacterium]